MATKLATIIADFTTQLASELAVGGTTATLSSATDDDGVALPSGRYFFTLDGANSKKEHISCDLVGTALTNIKTVSRQGVETAGVLRKHRIGASIGITDFAHILQINALLKSTTGLDATNPIKYDAEPTFSDRKQIIDKGYADDLAIAGSPDATTSTKGIVKTSVAPVTANSPIAVGQNDPQFVNYFAESGAANAYVITPSPSIGAYAVGQRFSFKATNANTTTSTLNINSLGAKTIFKEGGAVALASGDIAAGMMVVVEYDGTNFIMLNPVANAPLSTSSWLTNLTTTALCAETLAVGDPVASFYYQSDNGIQFDAKASTGGTTTTSGGTVNLSLTVAANSNRTVVAFVECASSGGTTGVTATFDGVTMTNRLSNVNLQSSNNLYAWTLGNANSGASRNLAITFPNNAQQWGYWIFVYSYYNTDTANIDAASSSANASSASITPTNEGALYVTLANSTTLSANNLSNTQSQTGSFSLITSWVGDSGTIVPKMPFSDTIGAANGLAWIGLKPATAPSYGYAAKTSASNATNSANKNKYDTFMGIVRAVTGGGVLGQTATIQTDGVVTGLSGLTPLTTYYLSNTSGTLSTTAGTNSKKVGIALTATTLLLKHDNS